MNAAPALKVFVVDDDRDTTDCMQWLLRHMGHEVRTANDGRSAVEQAPVFRPDLMLVDLAMPNFDGLAVARGIRQRPELFNISLICLSGYGDKAHQDLAREAGFDECLIKPLPADGLKDLVERVRGRIAEAAQRAERARAVAAETQELNKKARASVDAHRARRASKSDPIATTLEASGEYTIVSVPDRPQADELRHWLRHHGCRVGPLSDELAARVEFVAYERRDEVRLHLEDHPRCQIEG